MKENQIRKDFMLKIIDVAEELMKEAETEAEQKLIYEMLKRVKDSVEFIDTVKH